MTFSEEKLPKEHPLPDIPTKKSSKSKLCQTTAVRVFSKTAQTVTVTKGPIFQTEASMNDDRYCEDMDILGLPQLKRNNPFVAVIEEYKRTIPNRNSPLEPTPFARIENILRQRYVGNDEHEYLIQTDRGTFWECAKIVRQHCRDFNLRTVPVESSNTYQWESTWKWRSKHNACRQYY
ncbi:hypothetical protein SNE40_006204 [Patella caerulea]|uniref:Uncharacterized protein n=1 Tax=Patella caerulea TaxID=87958 RepID=A0AAN8K722_PATCE